MPDESTEQQDQSTTVGGIEPSILVRFVDNANPGDNTQNINLFPFDDGGPRLISRGGDPVLVTSGELNQLTALISIDVIDKGGDGDQAVEASVAVADPTPDRPGEPVLSPAPAKAVPTPENPASAADSNPTDTPGKSG